jgi:hypothetical protein
MTPKNCPLANKMVKHFVTFQSPGSFTAEQSTKEIKSWNVPTAVRMSRKIKERHGALPYGFYFHTEEQKDGEWGVKTTKTSGTYFLGGKVKTVADVKAENDPKNEILIRNMEYNGYDRIVVNDNSWRWTQPLKKGDVVLDMSKYKGNVVLDMSKYKGNVVLDMGKYKGKK